MASSRNSATIALRSSPAQLLGGDAGAVQRVHRRDELAEIPVVLDLRRGVGLDDVLDHLGQPDLLDLLGEVLAFEHGAALRVDDHALGVHHVVVLEDVLALDEVLLLDLLLRVLDLVREDLLIHGLVVRDLEPVHDVVEPVAGEQAHEVVLAREVEARLAGVSLAARAAAELVVDAAGLVALGAEHVEPAEPADLVVDLDVDAAAGHVRRDRDRADLTCVLDDLGLARVLLRVQHLVRDALALQQLAEELRGLDGDRPDEHRLARRVALLDVGDDGGELALDRLEDQVVLVASGRRRRSWGSGRPRGRRSRRTPSPRSSRCRSSRRACRRAGSSSGG